MEEDLIDPTLNTAEVQTNFEALQAHWWPPIRSHIDEVIQDRCGKSLRRLAEYQLDTGGKRLRALLPVRIAQACGQDPRRVLPFAAACELIHNASLAHDDIQDGDTVRRGRPTVWKAFSIAEAMNLGSAMLYEAILLIQRLEVDAALREQILNRILHATLEVIEGQCQEKELRAQPEIRFADYRRMVEGKTASFLV